MQEAVKPIWKSGKTIVSENYGDHSEINESKWIAWLCPNCGELVGEQYRTGFTLPHKHKWCKYCPECGTKIDWSNAEELEMMNKNVQEQLGKIVKVLLEEAE